MPYANYDDVQSIQAVYNHCLKQDADMNFVEFIAEKLIGPGFDTGEEDEPKPQQSNQPVNTNAVVQIQSGTLYQQPTTEMNMEQPVVAVTVVPTTNSGFPLQEYYPGIFHPPAPGLA